MSYRQVSRRVRLIMLACASFLAVLIFVGGAQPGAADLFVPPVDKWAHAGVFGLLAWLLWLGFDRRGALRILGLILIIGLADEGHQLMLSGRHADWVDLGTDFSAAAIVLMLLRLRDDRGRGTPDASVNWYDYFMNSNIGKGFEK